MGQCFRTSGHNKQQIIARHRQIALESQLRAGQITVRDFIRGLVLSDSFRRLNYESNNNYRFVEMCIQRVLGRQVYNHRETLSWSIVLATKGLNGFVDNLFNTEEYLSQFGDTTVPYQRRRILPQRFSPGKATATNKALKCFRLQVNHHFQGGLFWSIVNLFERQSTAIQSKFPIGHLCMLIIVVLQCKVKP